MCKFSLSSIGVQTSIYQKQYHRTMNKHPLFALFPIVLSAAMLLTACDDDSQPVDPTPTQIDSLSFENFNDTINVRAVMKNYTGSTTQPVVFFRPGYTNHAIELEADSVSAGSVTITCVNGTTAVWQHTITAAETSWKAEGEVGGAYNGVLIQASNATGVFRVKTEPK